MNDNDKQPSNLLICLVEFNQIRLNFPPFIRNHHWRSGSAAGGFGSRPRSTRDSHFVHSIHFYQYVRPAGGKNLLISHPNSSNVYKSPTFFSQINLFIFQSILPFRCGTTLLTTLTVVGSLVQGWISDAVSHTCANWNIYICIYVYTYVYICTCTHIHV